MAEFGEVKDSGERTQFSTGSQRDSQEGKGRFDLIPLLPIERLAQHFENGARKYDDDNWKKGQPLRQYVNSAMRHLYKMSEGWLDEDHAAAVMWNAAAFIWTKDAIDRGVLPAELDDIPWETDAEDEQIEDEVRSWAGGLIVDGGEPAKIVVPHGDGTQTEITREGIAYKVPAQTAADIVSESIDQTGLTGFHNPESDVASKHGFAVPQNVADMMQSTGEGLEGEEDRQIMTNDLKDALDAAHMVADTHIHRVKFYRNDAEALRDALEAKGYRIVKA